METPDIVSPEAWRQERDRLLADEKAHTRAGDRLVARRRRLPAVEFDATHRFEGPDGEVTLAELFEGRPQLIAYHAMLDPGADPCEGCSMFTDQLPQRAHLHARDTTLVLTSRAPQPEIQTLKDRMGWTVPWVTVVDEDFYRACGIEGSFGLSVFLRDGERVLRTYATEGRATEALGTVWTLLDLTPLGRQETWEDTPDGRPQGPPYAWWRLHDEY
ncbi:MAG: DUF899 domain-containing protein [Iamia sp.]